MPYNIGLNDVVIMLACNDPNNGVHTGRCDAIEILTDWQDSDPLLKLEGAAWRCSLVADTDRVWPDGERFEGILHFGKLSLPWRDAKSYVGNWCWDAVVVPVSDAARLIATLWQSPRWDIEEGEQSLFDAWKARTTRPGLTATQQWEVLLRHQTVERGLAPFRGDAGQSARRGDGGGLDNGHCHYTPEHLSPALWSLPAGTVPHSLR